MMISISQVNEKKNHISINIFGINQIQGTPCDLVTGEEKRTGNTDGSAANHVAITIEMAPVDRKCELNASIVNYI